MPIAPFFSRGTASVASADLTWFGIAQTAAPNAYLGDSAFTVFSTSANYSGSTAQQRLGGISSRRGRQFELDTIQAGEASVMLRNRDGYVDPQNVSSPYYPNVKPLKRVRAVRHQGGVRYPLFDGLVERITPEYRVPRTSDGVNIGYQDVEIGCVDAFEVLNYSLLESGRQALTSTVGPFLTFTAVETGESDLTISMVELAANTLATTVAVSGRDITFTLKTDASNISTETGTGLIAVAAASVAASALVTVTGSSLGNTIILSAHSYGPVAVDFGGTFASEPSGTRLTRCLTAISWPTAASSIDAGLYSVVAGLFGRRISPTSALTHMNEVASGELGYLFVAADGTVTFHDGDHRATSSRSLISQITFTDTGSGGVPYQQLQVDYSRDHVVNSVTVTPGAGEAAVQTVADSTATMVRSRSVSTLLTTSASALAVATNIYDAYNTAVPRIQQLVTLDNGTTAWRNVLLLEIGDRVTVVSNPPGHRTSISQACYVEQIQHDLVFGGVPHRVTLQLTQISASTSGGGSGGGGSGGAMKDSSGDDLLLDDGAAGILG